MKVVTPLEVTTEALNTTNVTESVALWSAGSYSATDQVIFDGYLYEALSTTSDQPDIGAAKSSPTWSRLGVTNSWRMFRDGQDSPTVNAVSIDVNVTAIEAINRIAVLGVKGVTVRVVFEPPESFIPPGAVTEGLFITRDLVLI